jgi:hypothetical protein
MSSPLSCTDRFKIKNIRRDWQCLSPEDAFQRLVSRLHEDDYDDFRSFPTLGRDGGIDCCGLDRETGKRVFFECKYTDGDGDQETLMRIWKKTQSTLERNLVDEDRAQSQYRPWFRQDPPVGKYLFCVSVSLANASVYDTLRDTIRGLFRDLAMKHPHLTHLSDITVDVLDWSRINLDIDKKPGVSWLLLDHQLPLGITRVGAPTQPGRFHAYLTSIPYLSRAEFRQRYTDITPAEFPTEDEILTRLKHDPGIVISGRTGIGKTRLMIELGKRAEESGWVVFRMGESARDEDVRSLVNRLRPQDRCILLVDYVETKRVFHELIQDLPDWGVEHGLTLRYIANCRTSYLPGLSHQGYGLSLSPLAESAECHRISQLNEAYATDVVRHILKDITLQDTAQPEYQKLIALCRRTPILAVFFHYLHSRSRTMDTDKLRGEKDFETWFDNRITRTYIPLAESDPTERRKLYELLARLFALLPCTTDVIRRVQQQADFEKVLENLLADGWMEQRDDDGLVTWAVIHDLLTDKVVTNYLQSTLYTLATSLERLISTALEFDSLKSVVEALERVADHPSLSPVATYEAIANSIRQNQGQWQVIWWKLLPTPLMGLNEKAAILAEFDDFWASHFDRPAFQQQVAWLLKQISVDISSGNLQAEIAAMTIQPLVVQLLTKPIVYPFLLTQCFKLFPDLSRPLVQAFIRERPRLYGTRYLMKAWLDSGEPCNSIPAEVGIWLSVFHSTSTASYVFKSWLHAGGDKAVVQPYIKAWLAIPENAVSMDASFVFQSWLQAHGDNAIVEPHIKAWLAKPDNALAPQAQFVFKAWLDAEGDMALVELHIKAWLAIPQNAMSMQASYVLQSWLDAQGDKAVVQPYVKAWLDIPENALALNAEYVFQSWLHAEGDKAVVQPYIEAWLAIPENAVSMEASFVFQSWLQAEGDKAVVQPYIKAWLDIPENAASMEASFIFKSWLHANGDEAMVEPYIKAWLEIPDNAVSTDAQFVYKIWLDAGGDKAVVQPYVKAWLAKSENALALHAQYVFKSWLQAEGDKAVLQPYIKAWLEIPENAVSRDAQFVFKSWLDARGDKAIVEPYIKAWLAIPENAVSMEASFVFQSWLDARGDKAIVEPYIKAWLDIPENAASMEASFIFKSWLDAHGDKAIVEPHIKAWLDIPENALVLHAQYVFKSWLDAGGYYGLVGAKAEAWLTANKEHPEAEFVIARVAAQQNLSLDTALAIMHWCKCYLDHPETLWRLARLRQNLRREELAERAVSVVDSLLHPERTHTVEDAKSVEIILSYLDANPACQMCKEQQPPGPQCENLNHLFSKWFRMPDSFSQHSLQFRFLQQAHHFERCALLIQTGLIQLGTDDSAIAKWLTYVDKWDAVNKKTIAAPLNLLRQQFPNYEHLWSIVKF